ncbi:MAG TPA: hypothetical protein VFF13_06015 [archaeon]|nr:hypothetical protein [archaeon]
MAKLRAAAFAMVALALIISGCIQVPENNNQTNENENQNIPIAPTTYTTQAECEQTENCECLFVMCDYIPEGKTFEETCGIGFKKGWACR